jgi:hypothetical protein
VKSCKPSRQLNQSLDWLGPPCHPSPFARVPDVWPICFECATSEKKVRGIESIILAEQNRSGENGSPQPALISDGGLGNVHGAYDLVGNSINLFFFIPR